MSAPTRRASDKETVRARRRRRRRRRLTVVSVATVIVVAGAGTAWAMSGDSGPTYRLATVERGSVAQTVDESGSLAAKRVDEASFSVGGTVAGVDVAIGDTVTAGQTLATLNTTSLQAAVTSAQDTLAQAQQKLTDDEDGVADTTTGGGNGGSATGGSATTTSYGTDSASATLLSDTSTPTGTAGTTGTSHSGSGSGSSSIATLRAQVGQDADALVTALQAQLTLITSACTTSAETTGSQITAEPDSTGTIAGTLGSSTSAIVTLMDGKTLVQAANTGSPLAAGSPYSFTKLTPGTSYTVVITRTDAVDSAACTGAVTTASTALDAPRATFATDLAALQQAVAAAGTSSGSGQSSRSGTAPTGTSSGTSTGGSTKRSGTSSSSSSSSSSAATVTASAEQIAADQAAITAAQAKVAVAQQQVSAATLTAPIAGIVAAVGLTAGDTVSSGSSSSTVAIVGTGALSVDVSVPLTKIALVKVGQTAQVTVDGRSSSVPGTVTFVGTLNSATSSTTASYTVTVQLDKTDSTLYDGMGASVSIDVGSASNTPVIPLSALHTVGTRTFVYVMKNGTPTTTVVTTGVVGSDTVQITQGVTAGQQIVIADLSEAVPSTTSTTTTRRGGGSGLSGLTGGTEGGFGGGTGRFGGGTGRFGGR